MPNEFDTLLSNSKTARRVGTCTRTLSRWTCQPELGFPDPCIINGRRYFSAWQVEDWLENRKPGSSQMSANIAPMKPGLIPPEPKSTARLSRERERREAKQSVIDRLNSSEAEFS